MSLFVVLVASNARSADKAACASAAETGQHLKNDGKLVDARQQFLICARADCPAAVSQDCVKWLGETESGIGSLGVKAFDADGKPLDGAHVFLDGTEQQPGSVEIDPGRHVVRVERPGFTPSESTVEIAAGEKRQLDVKLAPAPVIVEAPKQVSTWSVPAAAWILGGVGVVGMAGFAIFGGLGIAEQNDLRKSCAPNCTPSQVSPVSTKFAIADTSLVVGAVALTAAVIITIFWPSRSTRNASNPLMLVY